MILLTPGIIQMGWATKRCRYWTEDGQGIGDDDQSFAYDGCRGYLWQEQQPKATDLRKQWKAGDVVGALLDLTAMRYNFSLNGLNDSSVCMFTTQVALSMLGFRSLLTSRRACTLLHHS